MRRCPLAWVVALLLVLVPGLRADAYTTTMTGALSKYRSVEAVPYDSIMWISRTYDKSPAEVRRDMAALPAPTPPPAPEGATAVVPEEATPESAAASEPTTGGFTWPSSLESTAMEQWAEQNGLPPWTFRLVRGLFALLLLVCAVPLWAAPRGLQNASPHVRSASVTTGLLPRLLALYLVGAGLWEVAGTYDPQRFALGRWVTIFQELGPPIRDAVKGLPIFQGK